MVLIGSAILITAATLFAQTQQRAASQDQAPVVRRLAATAQLAAQEYRLGIQDGRVISQAEVDEARLFLGESRRSAASLPAEVRSATIAGIDTLLQMVDRIGAPDSIDARVKRLASSLSTRFGVPLDEIPAKTPALARGAHVYQTNCAGCHGSLGRGDGPLARNLDPKPSNLADWNGLRDQSPLDYFRRISIGVVGTAMPAFESRLSADDRWAAAVYATLLRLPPQSGTVPAALQPFATTGRMSDAELLVALEEADTSPAALARISAVRAFQPDASASSNAQVIDHVRAQV